MAGASGVSVVLDTSSLLAVLNVERGSDIALQSMRGAAMSAVNFSETVAKAGDQGASHAGVERLVERLRIEIIAFDRAHATAAASLRPMTVRRNVSFADRACLSLARLMSRPALTGDTKWSDLDLGIDIIQIR